MTHELEEDKNINISFVTVQQRVMKRMESEYGIAYYLLLYTAIFTTLFIVSYLRPPKFYNDFISKIFNISLRWKGTQWKVYHLLMVVLIILGTLLVFLQMLTYQFSPSLNIAETYENKMYRLKYKWMLETQIWLLTLIVIEIASIYKLSSLYDDMLETKEKLYYQDKEEKIHEIERIENIPTMESMRYNTNENIIH